MNFDGFSLNNALQLIKYIKTFMGVNYTINKNNLD